VPLKWHYPLGLLFDLYGGAEPATSRPASRERLSPTGMMGEGRRPSNDQQRHQRSDAEQHHESPALPWRLTVHFSEWPDQDLVRLDADGRVMHDAFINSVKEADFLRNGTAKGIMTLSKEDSYGLWQAVQDRMYQAVRLLYHVYEGLF
jgi:autophagy-related protein 5